MKRGLLLVTLLLVTRFGFTQESPVDGTKTGVATHVEGQKRVDVEHPATAKDGEHRHQGKKEKKYEIKKEKRELRKENASERRSTRKESRGERRETRKDRRTK